MNNGAEHVNGVRNGTAKKPRKRGTDAPRPLPYSAEAERSVLGGIIIKNSVLDRIDTLTPDHFFNPKNQIVFHAMRTLQAAQRPIDVVTLESEIERMGKLDAIEGVAYLGELALAVPTADNVVAYSKIVREKHLFRELMMKASEAAEKCSDYPFEADELLGETIANLQQLERGYREDNERVPTISIFNALEEIERLARTPVYETPFPDLNRILGFGGLLSGQIYYLAGGTGFGKTSWLAEVVKNHARSPNQSAIVAFYEMFAGYYVARMAARELGVHSNEILRELGRDGIKPSDVLRVLPPQIEFLDCPTLSMLKRAIERHTRKGHAPPLVVVDYIQLLADQLMATMTRPDARMANALASAGLRSIAKETGAAVIVVSGASRSTGKKLMLDVRKTAPRDLIDAARESGAIEYDGAGVIVLSVSDDKDGFENIATMTVAKARFGEAYHIDARYDGRTGGWREIGRVSTTLKSANGVVSASTAPVRDAILRVLRKAGPQPSKSKIASLSGKRKEAINSEVDVMLDEGVLEYASGKIAITGERPIAADPRTAAMAQTAIQGVE